MPKRFFSTAAIGGYGTILITFIIFFAQGGFGKITPFTSLYIIGLVTGSGLILFSVTRPIDNIIKTKNNELDTIIPTLENMDSFLHDKAIDESKKPVNISAYLDSFNHVMVEILGTNIPSVQTIEDMRRESRAEHEKLIKQYRNEDIWLEKADIISGALDNLGWGLKEYKKKGTYAKQYRKLMTLRNKVIDESLNDLIKKHIVLSETWSNMLLQIERAEIIKVTYQSKQIGLWDFLESTIIGVLGNIGREARERTAEIRAKIGNRIKELKNDDGKENKRISRG
jgi:hypothetical protein